MKTLELERMEQVEGGSCGNQVAITAGTIILSAAVPGGIIFGIGRVLLGYGRARELYAACFA